MLEINPLVVTKDNKIICLDAKVGFDDNALYRHPDMWWRCATSPKKTRRKSRRRNTTSTTSRSTAPIGCMVNGAGLAMATNGHHQALRRGRRRTSSTSAARATKEKVAAAFKIITSDPNVKGILVNIFGGIMKCDVIAEGVVAAVKEVGLKVPLVVRLEGTNVELGKKIIDESGPQRHLGATISTMPRRRSSKP